MNSIFFLTFILDKEYLEQYSCCKSSFQHFCKKKICFYAIERALVSRINKYMNKIKHEIYKIRRKV